MRRQSQVRFGGRRRGDHRPKDRHRRLAADPARRPAAESVHVVARLITEQPRGRRPGRRARSGSSDRGRPRPRRLKPEAAGASSCRFVAGAGRCRRRLIPGGDFSLSSRRGSRGWRLTVERRQLAFEDATTAQSACRGSRHLECSRATRRLQRRATVLILYRSGRRPGLAATHDGAGVTSEAIVRGAGVCDGLRVSPLALPVERDD